MTFHRGQEARSGARKTDPVPDLPSPSSSSSSPRGSSTFHACHSLPFHPLPRPGTEGENVVKKKEGGKKGLGPGSLKRSRGRTGSLLRRKLTRRSGHGRASPLLTLLPCMYRIPTLFLRPNTLPPLSLSLFPTPPLKSDRNPRAAREPRILYPREHVSLDRPSATIDRKRTEFRTRSGFFPAHAYAYICTNTKSKEKRKRVS